VDAPGTGLLDRLDPGKFQQVVVGGSLLAIQEDFLGPHNLAEFLPGIGITRVKIGMNALDGLAECRPQAFGVVTRQRAEQIVKRIHARPAGLSYSPHENGRREFVRSTKR
jgi:hypothetical protein